MTTNWGYASRLRPPKPCVTSPNIRTAAPNASRHYARRVFEPGRYLTCSGTQMPSLHFSLLSQAPSS